MNLIGIRMVGTQILGFLLLLWGLRKWAWGPLTAQLEARRQRIAGEFAEAERRQKDADVLKAKLEQDLRGIEAQARARLQESVAEGQKVAAEIRAQAQKDAQDRLAKAEDEMMREREKAKEILKEQVIALSLTAAEKILKQRLDDPAQRKLAGQFIDEVGSLR
jgi:F-type H+-transporting ATPase subunit b